MCYRRNKSIFQGAVFFALLGGLGYTFYLYNIVSMDLEISKSEANRYLRKQESFSSQLQVVYEHRARLERSLQKEKADHKNTKLEYSKKQKEFILNITRSKHENMNRFNSLETSHNMLKAQNKELDTEYSRLQQQYSRLSSEHSTLNNQQKRNYQLFKEQKANEITSLDEEIKTLKKQVVALRTHLKTREEELERYKLSSAQELRQSEQYQETISTLEEELASYKKSLERLEKAQQRSQKTVGQNKLEKDKTSDARQQGSDLHNSFKSEVLTQGDKEKTEVEKANRTGSLGMESIHADEHKVLDRHRRETSLPATHSNADEEKGLSSKNQEQDNIQLGRREDSRRTEDSFSESEQVRHDVPLRDSEEDTGNTNRKYGVHVVSATDKSVNGWESIIKAERDSRRANQEGREGNEEGIEEDGEEENVRERNRRSVDDADTSRLQNKNEQNYVQKQPGEGEVANERRGVAQLGDKDGEQNEQGYQDDDTRRRRAQYGEKQSNKRGEEEAREGDGQDNELSRKKINEQVAGMQEDFHEEQIQQQNEDWEDQRQLKQQIQPQFEGLSLERNNHYEARELPTHIELTAIPATSHDTAQDHRDRSDAENDDEDANTEQDTEEDPDDVEEVQENDNIESFKQQQQQQQHQQPLKQDTQRIKPIQGQQGLHHKERTFNRALKHADDNNNNEQSQQA